MSAQLRLHFIVFLWGFTAVLGKLISLDANHLVWYRMGLTSVFLIAFITFFQKESIFVRRDLAVKLVGVGSLMAIHWLLFFHSIKVSNVSITLACISTATLFVAFIEPLVFRRRIDWTEILMGVVITACMLLIFKTEIRYKEGIIYGVLCAFFGALFSVFNGRLHGQTSSGNIITYEIFGGFLILTLYFLFTDNLVGVGTISLNDFWWTLLLASVFTAYPMFESIRLMRHISPFTLVLAVNLEPVYGIFFAYLIFGESEHMSVVFYLASAVMLLAIVLNGIIKARKRR
ncbi:DMT family transporter [Capnocytophaga cynodegmi]|uniref:Predicted permease n=1 Tax=Capnocytophaga cynodegmi TaxID=28189 RepID=A0A0B7H1E5_9FLAO|nr:DMT family transporter [Capnocytophaga cynodegmi]CEN32394.1 Predicted permease [Capnocytophaga cynodegmi]